MGAEAEAKAQKTARNSKTKGRGFFFDMAGAQRAKLSWGYPYVIKSSRAR